MQSITNDEVFNVMDCWINRFEAPPIFCMGWLDYSFRPKGLWPSMVDDFGIDAYAKSLLL